jgi:hypothetical protein
MEHFSVKPSTCKIISYLPSMENYWISRGASMLEQGGKPLQIFVGYHGFSKSPRPAVYYR